MRKLLLVVPLVLAAAAMFVAAGLPQPAEEKVDVATIERIKAEAEQHSQVMEVVSWLTDVYGPRLTGSPNTRDAADWAVKRMQEWGLSTARLETWGPYDGGSIGLQWGPLNRGWTNEQFAFRAVAPYPFTIIAAPATYSPGTKGRVTGPAIRFDVHSFADMQRFAGKLRGAFLLMDPARPTPAHFEPQAARWTDKELEGLASGISQRVTRPEVIELRYAVAGDPRALRWLANEGVCALLYTAPGDGGTIVMAGEGSTGPTKKNTSGEIPEEIPLVKVSAESYGRIARILEKNLPVTLELDMQNTFYDDPGVFNIVAEIPGTDPKLKDEVVMIGAHFDSWTFGTGATDDGAGAAVMMEAMRIVKALNLQPRRTIRLALWTGEEQGALGSRAYVQRHLPDRERYRFSVYFNLDAGTGKIRGVFQQGNTAVGPIFQAWMGPFKENGMKTVSILDIGGGDNFAFDEVGLPSFGFIQDPIEYETRTHHTSADVYERIQPRDLRFNAAVLGSFAWQAAQRDEKLPRKAPQG